MKDITTDELEDFKSYLLEKRLGAGKARELVTETSEKYPNLVSWHHNLVSKTLAHIGLDSIIDLEDYKFILAISDSCMMMIIEAIEYMEKARDYNNMQGNQKTRVKNIIKSDNKYLFDITQSQIDEDNMIYHRNPDMHHEMAMNRFPILMEEAERISDIILDMGIIKRPYLTYLAMRIICLLNKANAHLIDP